VIFGTGEKSLVWSVPITGTDQT